MSPQNPMKFPDPAAELKLGIFAISAVVFGIAALVLWLW